MKNQKTNPRILIIDAYSEFADMVRQQLKILKKMDIEVLFASNPSKARFILEEEKLSIDLIVVSSCVKNFRIKPRKLPTVSFVREICRSFNGVLIAASLIPEYRNYLLEAGCHIEVEDKRTLYKTIAHHLKE